MTSHTLTTDLQITTMKLKHILIFVVITLFITSCKNDDEIDPNYPTTVKTIAKTDSIKLTDQIESSGLYACTYINDFGIPYIDSIDTYVDYENWKFDTDETKLRALLKQSIIEYGSFVNVYDTSNIDIKIVKTLDNDIYSKFITEFPDSLPPFWLVTTTSQVFDSMNVRGTNLEFLFSTEGLISLSGRWYNEVYIPATDIYTEDLAKESLFGKTYGTGTTAILIEEDTYWNPSSKVIVPIVKANIIELRICWLLHPENWEIMIDTQSGQIWSSINFDNL